ncbi:MAG TPA: NUMOD3 domain-containing DNA-binding protein [Candidatus Paceibacterota bacterium]|nr:NUMOD3 domain-containing DNA-binding protein [Candidatus Paceibacterota bacterium]
MFINKEEKIRLEVKGIRRIIFLQKIGLDSHVGGSIEIPWYYLRTSSLRRYRLKLKCDDCGREFDNRIENLDKDKDIHFCYECINKGRRNPMYNKKLSQEAKDKLISWHKNNENPAKRKEVREKISKAKKGKPSSMLGKKHKEESKIKCRISNQKTLKKLWKSGKLDYHSKYANSKINFYKGIKYQGTYELDFLKKMENWNLLHLIERGPAITYIDKKGKERIYLIDYKIKGTNLLIEIKSSYTITLDRKNLLLKEKYAKKEGNYIIIIDKNYSPLKENLMNYEIK